MEQNQNGLYPPNQYGGFPQYPYQPPQPKKHSGAKIAAISVSVCAVLITMLLGVYYVYTLRPAYRVTKGIQNLERDLEASKEPLTDMVGMDDIELMMQNEGSHVQADLDLTVDVPVYGDVTLGITSDFYKDMQAKKLSLETAFSVMRYNFAHLDIYADDEQICFSVPELFLEDLYIDNEDLVSQYNDSILAYYLGEADQAEDFSIDLFRSADERISLRDFRSESQTYKKLETDMDACRERMTVVKAGHGLYRVTFPQKEVNRLVEDMVDLYADAYDMDTLGILGEYDRFVDSDVSLLFEISRGNHIRSIEVEEPVSLLDGEASFGAELLLKGENRGTDLMQGKVEVTGIDGVVRSVVWQVERQDEEESAGTAADMKLTVDGETIMKMKLTYDFDRNDRNFDLYCSAEDDTDICELVARGDAEDFVQGESVTFDLHKIELSMNDERLFTVSGDISIEPLTGSVKKVARPETAFFEMSIDDWYEVIYQIDNEYKDLLNYF